MLTINTYGNIHIGVSLNESAGGINDPEKQVVLLAK